MDTVLALLDELNSMTTGHPLGFASVVILVMITEGLLLVGIISFIQKLLIRSDA